ncbi:MAG: FKBP-type peptidyl-prolyl cis-trans isomerase [Verrucomicrobiota bacterium]
MDIQKDKVVSIDYKLTDDSGQVLDTSEGREPLAYLHGHQNIVPGLEKALEGKSEGESLDVVVEPSEGYGEINQKLVQEVPRSQFPADADLQVGMMFRAQTNDGQERVFTIKDIGEEVVTVDGNHPLAGANLNFAVQIKSVREASEEELEHGHAHGAGGHQH